MGIKGFTGFCLLYFKASEQEGFKYTMFKEIRGDKSDEIRCSSLFLKIN